MDTSMSKLWEMVKDREGEGRGVLQSIESQKVRHDWDIEHQDEMKPDLKQKDFLTPLLACYMQN